MCITIVYKTYAADLPWLYYSLKSIQKFVSGYTEILIYYHNECHKEFTDLMKRLQLPIRAIPVAYDYHGYIKQMTTKLLCWKDVKTDYVAFVDSDNIFNRTFDFTTKLNLSKIRWCVLRRTDDNMRNDTLLQQAFNAWGKAVQRMTHIPMDTYYMANGFPFIVLRKTLEDAEREFVRMHGESYDSFCKKEIDRIGIVCSDKIRDRFMDLATVFEEFEYLGWFAENHTADYNFVDTRDTDTPILYFWSHGGITPSVKRQIDELLGKNDRS